MSKEPSRLPVFLNNAFKLMHQRFIQHHVSQAVLGIVYAEQPGQLASWTPDGNRFGFTFGRRISWLLAGVAGRGLPLSTFTDSG